MSDSFFVGRECPGESGSQVLEQLVLAPDLLKADLNCLADLEHGGDDLMLLLSLLCVKSINLQESLDLVLDLTGLLLGILDITFHIIPIL